MIFYLLIGKKHNSQVRNIITCCCQPGASDCGSVCVML